MKQPLPLILPVENQVREFDAKLLLACVAAENGVRAFVGCHARIGERMHAFPRSVYVAKAVSPGSMKLFRIVQQLGHGLAAWDEEALVYMSPSFYLRRKVSPESLGKPATLFAWGEDNAEIWRNAQGYRSQPLHVTGNPRGDLLRADIRGFHQPEADALRRRFGDFVLINSNFGGLNLFFSELNKPRLERMQGGTVPEDKVGTWEDPEMIRFRWLLFEKFQQMLPCLARRMPERRFVFRPHPSENSEIWQKIASGLPNVEVACEGGIVPWLLSASAVIQNGCTTGLESFLLGRPVIAYKPVADPVYDMDLPNKLGELATDVESLVAAVEKVAGSGQIIDEEQRRLVARYIDACEGPLASERILAAYHAMSADGLFEQATPLYRRVSGQIASRRRGLKKTIRGMKRGNFDSAEFVRHRFPDLMEADVERRLERFQLVTGRFRKLRPRQCWKNIFTIEAAPA